MLRKSWSRVPVASRFAFTRLTTRLQPAYMSNASRFRTRSTKARFSFPCPEFRPRLAAEFVRKSAYGLSAFPRATGGDVGITRPADRQVSNEVVSACAVEGAFSLWVRIPLNSCRFDW